MSYIGNFIFDAVFTVIKHYSPIFDLTSNCESKPEVF